MSLRSRKNNYKKNTEPKHSSPSPSLLPIIFVFFPPISLPLTLSSSLDFPLSLCNSPASVLLAIAAAFRVFRKLQHQFNNNTSPWNPSPYWPPSRAISRNFYFGIKGCYDDDFLLWKVINVFLVFF